jgi:hypothetical protein
VANHDAFLPSTQPPYDIIDRREKSLDTNNNAARTRAPAPSSHHIGVKQIKVRQSSAQLGLVSLYLFRSQILAW